MHFAQSQIGSRLLWRSLTGTSAASGQCAPSCLWHGNIRRFGLLLSGVPAGKRLIQLIESYKRLLLAAQPVHGDDANNKSIVVVFTDLPAAEAEDFFSGVLQQIGVPSYADDGLVMGPFYEGNDGTALYNPNFRPFRSPVPLLLMRRAVISDWKFFLNNEEWLPLWARRYGVSAVEALADELRRLPWQARRD